jgi:hypothetical protein
MTLVVKSNLRKTNLRKLLANKEIELEIGRELLKKVWDIRSKEVWLIIFMTKHKISKPKLSLC